MSKTTAPAALLILCLAGFGTPAFADDVVPCENALANLRSAVGAATALSDADKTQIQALQDKGIERCNADDDARADDFFAQAMKILGK